MSGPFLNKLRVKFVFKHTISDLLYPITEKTIHDEETSDVDLAESMAELKVCRSFYPT